MILVIDNYDSFTYNLVQYLGELGVEVKVIRNDAMSAVEALAMAPSHIVISPGPCTPNEAGVSLDLISLAAGRIPTLGVCLGLQAIGQAFGGKVVRAKKVKHGKTSPVFHDERSIHKGLPNPFTATRYHSLVLERASFPPSLAITAWSDDEAIMGIEHREMSIFGVQYHPESIMTEGGKKLLSNFLNAL
ncbi:MAG: aminodeoxychorismate/anthranilate synthase component II [Chlorobi bacterium]|nr:aminodeoxychorismate/anthranilate synthase component II [Chlorobiota bacterium]